jgi:D-glycero-alpha-D-manno-heptose-7-phosphate kinase
VIITKTPFRISFFGGGTDYPDWYKDNEGSVLSVAIDKYCYLTCRYLPPFFSYKYRIRYYQREEAKTLDEIEHPVVREALRSTGIDRGIDLVHHADLPARSGLGSSSTFTVGFLHALNRLKHIEITKYELARAAITLEQDIIKEAVGSQDQTAAAYGGLNRIIFGGSAEIDVRPVQILGKNLYELQDSLALFFTGQSRTASDIAIDQIKNIKKNNRSLSTLNQSVNEGLNILTSQSGYSAQEFGRLMHEQWLIKKELSKNISNDEVNDIYQKGIKNGAIGGKLLGAGGGGFILFVVQPSKKQALVNALKNYLHVPFKFDMEGSRVIHQSSDENY